MDSKEHNLTKLKSGKVYLHSQRTHVKTANQLPLVHFEFYLVCFLI